MNSRLPRVLDVVYVHICRNSSEATLQTNMGLFKYILRHHFRSAHDADYIWISLYRSTRVCNEDDISSVDFWAPNNMLSLHFISKLKANLDIAQRYSAHQNSSPVFLTVKTHSTFTLVRAYPYDRKKLTAERCGHFFPRGSEPLVSMQFRFVYGYVQKCDSVYLTSLTVKNVKPGSYPLLSWNISLYFVRIFHTPTSKSSIRKKAEAEPTVSFYQDNGE